MKKYIDKISKSIKNITKEQWLIIVLSSFLLILIIRIFYLQIIMWPYYKDVITKQSFWSTEILATRWDIYMSDKSWNPIKLTQNIESYNIFIDTKFTSNKQKLISLLSPILFEHFCIENWNNQNILKIQCIKNIEKRTNNAILPPDPQLFFKLDGSITTWYIYDDKFVSLSEVQIQSTWYKWIKLVTWYIYSWMNDEFISKQQQIKKDYEAQVSQTVDSINTGQIIWLISQKLDQIIYTWTRDKNFFRFIDNDLLINDLQHANINWLKIIANNYIYFYPNNIKESEKQKIIKKLQDIFLKYWETISDSKIDIYLSPQENRYVSIAKWINANIFYKINELKNQYTPSGVVDYINWLKLEWRSWNPEWWYIDVDSNSSAKEEIISKGTEIFNKFWFTLSNKAINRIKNSKKWEKFKLYPSWIWIFQWFWSEKENSRYYPNNNLLSNAIWYIDSDLIAHGGIEKFFDDILAWKNGKIVWLWNSRLWQVWSNDFEINPKIDWSNIYITIDPVIQKEVEKIIKNYQIEFRADSVAATIINPYNGKIVSMANYPNYNPNNLSEVYNLKPLELNNSYIIDDETQLDTPVYYETWWKLTEANPDIRKNLTIPKYIYKNIYWPKVLIDKNISLPYEPWSVLKWFTVWIWLDSDEISLEDKYYDKWNLVIDDFKISNVAKACLGTNSFLHALQFSCNVWMIRIIQKIWQRTYYNYLDKLWFGKQTWIELANEDAWFVADPNNNSKARFYNNSFWLGILATPMQLAAWYSALVNWWYYIKPTIIDKITNSNWQVVYKYEKPKRNKILKSETSDKIKYALYQVVNWWQIKKFAIPWYTLWGKTWTAQITYKWKYREWAWWTNGSFAWILTKDNLKYVVVIQIRRPRKSLRWELTAGKIFWDIAKFIISYDGLDS